MKNLLSFEEHNRLQELKNKIERNSANIKDYEDYKFLLTKYGIPEDIILKELKDNGYNDLKQYYNARKHPKNEKENYLLEGVLLGALIGLGIAVLIDIMRKGK